MLFVALLKIASVGLAVCVVAAVCEMMWPRLGRLLTKPAQFVASAVSALLLIICLGLVVGCPQPFLDLLTRFQLR
jgi:hypothetical protein